MVRSVVLYLKNHFWVAGVRIQLHEIGIIVENQGGMAAVVVIVFQNQEQNKWNSF